MSIIAVSDSRIARSRSFNVNAVADHPQLDLFQPRLPTAFELPHPLTVAGGIGHVDEEPRQLVPVLDPAVAPTAFDLLRFVGGSGRMPDRFQDCFRELIPPARAARH
jgi:hypothetical protein